MNTFIKRSLQLSNINGKIKHNLIKNFVNAQFKSFSTCNFKKSMFALKTSSRFQFYNNQQYTFCKKEPEKPKLPEKERKEGKSAHKNEEKDNTDKENKNKNGK